MKNKKYSEAQARASRKWNEKNLVQMNIKVRPEVRQNLTSYAERAGVSKAEFVRLAIEGKAERDGLK